MTSPIADLSYRNYDGPLGSPRLRWWVISRTAILQAFKKKMFWVAAAFSAWYYLVMIVVLFFVEQIGASSPQSQAMMSPFLQRIVWKDQFLHGFSFAQLVILLTALLLGAGSIANDNRANALLVYLSKPGSKLDYVIGKWVGIFLPLLLMMAIPTLLFYGYGAMSYLQYGFYSDDPTILPKMLVILPVSAALHTSLVLAISSAFNQGRIAGATYAGVYLLGNFFTQLMRIAWISSRGEAPTAIKTLYYCSVDGLQIGLAKSVLGTKGTMPFGFMNGGISSSVPAPPLAAMLAVVTLVTVVCLLVTWSRVRAVEVVGR